MSWVSEKSFCLLENVDGCLGIDDGWLTVSSSAPVLPRPLRNEYRRAVGSEGAG